jgi:hypothetical protein
MHYLESCLEAFPETCKKKYGVAFDLASIERKVAHLRRHSPLTYKDLKFFESPEHWWFKRFWVFPPEEHLGPALKGVTFDFWNLPGKKEENLIGKLLHAFKAIELVSIILRFIRPEKYAIFSSPTEMLLEIRRGRSPIETYVNYLTDLRLIQRQYRFGRVADVDMALWVLHEKCYGTHKDPKIERAFSGDTFLIRLIAKNLSSRLNDRSDAQLANALREAKPDLAALIACYALEVLIRKLAAAYGTPDLASNDKLETVINQMPNYGSVDGLRKDRWRWLKEIRNNLFHRGRIPTVMETDQLIKEVLRLEENLKSAIANM